MLDRAIVLSVDERTLVQAERCEYLTTAARPSWTSRYEFFFQSQLATCLYPVGGEKVARPLFGKSLLGDTNRTTP